MFLPAMFMRDAGGMVGTAAAIGVGAMFLSAGIAKVRGRRVFAGVVANYRLLPSAMARPVAAILPAVEIVVGLALLAGIGMASLPASAMLLIFAAAMTINIRRGRAHIDCGCGRSDLRQPLSAVLVLRNCALAIIAPAALLPLPAPGSPQWLVGLAGGTALFLMTFVVNALAALLAGPLAMERNSR